MIAAGFLLGNMRGPLSDFSLTCFAYANSHCGLCLVAGWESELVVRVLLFLNGCYRSCSERNMFIFGYPDYVSNRKGVKTGYLAMYHVWPFWVSLLLTGHAFKLFMKVFWGSDKPSAVLTEYMGTFMICPFH